MRCVRQQSEIATLQFCLSYTNILEQSWRLFTQKMAPSIAPSSFGMSEPIGLVGQPWRLFRIRQNKK